MKNEGRVYFGLAGDFDPSELTKKIGIEPTHAEMMHERNFERKLPKCSHWDYSTENITEDILDIYHLSSAIVSDLEPHKEKIKEVIQEFDLNATLQVVLWISTDESISTPILGFTKEVIEFLSVVGASIDIDTYRYSEPVATGQRR